MKGVRGILLAASGVTDLVGSGANARVYPIERPQTSELPAITIKDIQNEPSDTKSGVSGLDSVTTEVLSYSNTLDGAITLSEAVRAALDRSSGTYNGETIQSIQYLNDFQEFEEIKNKKVYWIEQNYKVRVER